MPDILLQNKILQKLRKDFHPEAEQEHVNHRYRRDMLKKNEPFEYECQLPAAFTVVRQEQFIDSYVAEMVEGQFKPKKIDRRQQNVYPAKIMCAQCGSKFEGLGTFQRHIKTEVTNSERRLYHEWQSKVKRPQTNPREEKHTQ